jgi:hypothetical protein
VQSGRRVAVLGLLLVAGLAGCREAKIPAAAPEPNNTAVLGGYGPGPKASEPAPLVDIHGQSIPLPQLPAGVNVHAVRSADESALAVWVQDGHVFTSSFARSTGWTPAQPLEQIFGQASDPQIASNGQGTAMAVWRHTVGNIQSLRFSRFAASTGWSVPDVMPGALPRPAAEAAAAGQDAARLQMDAEGHVTARWPSGFNAAEAQTSRYVVGSGWSRAASERMASAPASTRAPPRSSLPPSP